MATTAELALTNQRAEYNEVAIVLRLGVVLELGREVHRLNALAVRTAATEAK